MAKKRLLGRHEVINKIALDRAAKFRSPDKPGEEELLGESPCELRYTTKQREVIATELGLDAASAAESIDAIELRVRLTAEALRDRSAHPVSPEQEKRFRDLKGPIAQILGVLEHPELGHLKDTLPHLQMELRGLRHMVDLDQRKGRGRPQDPINEHLKDLCGWLAKIWAEHRGWPKRWHRGDLGRDWGPFHRFLDGCLNPAGIRVSDHVIRSVIEKRGSM